MGDVLPALLLGVLQGLTEFIPVSSSGHLVLVPHFVGIDTPGIAFGVALHLGTFAAVVLYFRTDLALLIAAVFGVGDAVLVSYYRRLAALLVLGSIPIAIIGVALRGVFEAAFASPTAAAGFLMVTGLLLLAGEAARSRRGGITGATADIDDEHTMLGHDPGDPEGLTLDAIGVRQALVIGFGQCVALFPGISRSGTTIAAGMSAGLTRPAATRFSFLLALPALIGATVVSVPDLAEGTAGFGPLALTVGIVAAFVSGYLAIRWLLALVARDRLTGFAIYCLVVGGGSLIALSAGA
ncbi:MAG: undecaprenyl-diphosphate phosphatase [Actinobacteria bacterium]|nr:undecaprenyl-diphosphate phosphatase [Actinomycetota bacterium]